jgi:hypothetical protein
MLKEKVREILNNVDDTDYFYEDLDNLDGVNKEVYIFMVNLIIEFMKDLKNKINEEL